MILHVVYMKIYILSSFPKVPPPQPASLLKNSLVLGSSGNSVLTFLLFLVLCPEKKPSLEVVNYPGE